MPNNYAVIENNKVVNIVVSEADFAAEQGWVLAGENVAIGWDYNGDFIDNRPVPIPVAPPPAPTKEDLLAQLQALTLQIQAI